MEDAPLSGFLFSFIRVTGVQLGIGGGEDRETPQSGEEIYYAGFSWSQRLNVYAHI